MNVHKHVGHFGCGEIGEMRQYGVDWRSFCLKCDRWLDPPEISVEEYVDPNQAVAPPEPPPGQKFGGNDPVPSIKAGMTTLNRKEKKDVRLQEPEDSA